MELSLSLRAGRTVTLFSTTGSRDLIHDSLACSVRAETGSISSVAGTAGKESAHLILSILYLSESDRGTYSTCLAIFSCGKRGRSCSSSSGKSKNCNE